jgi:hypothetical protein
MTMHHNAEGYRRARALFRDAAGLEGSSWRYQEITYDAGTRSSPEPYRYATLRRRVAPKVDLPALGHQALVWAAQVTAGLMVNVFDDAAEIVLAVSGPIEGTEP